MFREMEEDPFFSDPFHSHQENLRQLMSSFPVQLDQDLLVNSPGGKHHHHHHHHHNNHLCPKPKCPKEPPKHPNVGNCSVDPFNHMMEQMRKDMLEMQHNIKHGSCSTDDHTLNTSTVMSYAKVGNEPPKVFQASTHVHRVPGGIRETRRAVKDSETGMEKLSIGHHIKDRAHVIQKFKNQRTGDEEVDQEFINLHEDEAEMFAQEWQDKVAKYLPPGTHTVGLHDIKKAMEGQRKCCQHIASVKGETELTCQVDDLSSELEDFRDKQLLSKYRAEARQNMEEGNRFVKFILPLLLAAALTGTLLLHA